MRTPLQSILQRVSPAGVEVINTVGCQIIGDGSRLFNEAVVAAQDGKLLKIKIRIFLNLYLADVAIVFLGLSMRTLTYGIPLIENFAVEQEDHDRDTLTLPFMQRNLLKSLKLRQSTPIILVLINGGPIALDWEAKNLDAIIEVNNKNTKLQIKKK